MNEEKNTNTFQAAVFMTDNGTFANFIYSNVGWTQGAEAGFNKGDSDEKYELPTSGTGNIMYLEEYGNTGIPGEWMFELGEEKIMRCKVGIKGDTCDEECSPGQWGADCSNCCHCSEGICNPLTGQCNSGCTECWTGTSCSIRLAIIIPVGIVAVWIVVLLTIVLYCYCKRTSSSRIRSMYGPTYPGRPITSYNMKRNSKTFEGSYEDHLEKAARLSSEMKPYNQNGRVSLYGSYWNLNNSPGSSQASNQRTSPYLGYPQQTRYQYTGRY